MRVTLVSHASLLVETNGVRILTDPWYEGRIYNNAWELCPPPPHLPDYKSLDALFISHAHPDHLEARTLTKIIAARGPNIPVFIAKFFNRNVRAGLSEIGFSNIVEMVPGRELSALRGVTFYSQQFRLDDSLIVIRGEDDETLVNINDTPLRGAVLHDLARRFPAVEYVAAQFAIAQGYPYCYDGIEADFDRRDLVRRFDDFARVLKPRNMIPFASFVRFCNADNAHMNAHKTSLEELQALSQTPLTILYPGDWIDRGVVVHEPAHRDHFERAQLATDVVATSEHVTMAEMDVAMQRFAANLAARVPRFILRKLPPFAFIVRGEGYGYGVEHNTITRGTEAELARWPIRYELAGEVLYDSVQHDWGWADLSIGARFRAHVDANWQSREPWFWIIPMLAGEGYLAIWNCWFLRPRSLQVLFGRRLEFLDYARSLLRGRFMSNVVRKKTASLGA